jgi:transcriptional regulator with XRE-family HTH domain
VLTSGQIRAARGLLGWSAAELSERASVSRRTLVKLEASAGVPQTTTRTMEKLREALETAGIEFIGTSEDGPGIRIWRVD